MTNLLINFLTEKPHEKERALRLFWNKVDKKENGCWVWIGKKSRQRENPYGLFAYRSVCKQKSFIMSAHRFSLAMHEGKDSELQVLHKCDNPPCIRPDHLRYGTHLENMKDMRLKGRSIRRHRLLDITEDMIGGMILTREENFANGGDAHSSMRAAAEYVLFQIFRGDPDKSYQEEIKSLKKEVEKLKQLTMGSET